MKSSRVKAVLLFAVILFLSSFLIRIRYPVSRPPQWFERSRAFESALHFRNWEQTYQQYHPGVTTMAIGAVGNRFYHGIRDIESPLMRPIQFIYDWAMLPYQTDYGKDTVGMIVALSAVISILIVSISLVLERLGGWKLAIAGGAFLAFSPFFLSQSRVLHVDALLGAFMMLSAVWMLRYLQTKKLIFVILSGLTGGFSLLTKSPAVFLLPYTGLVLLVGLLYEIVPAWKARDDGRIGWLLKTGWRQLVGPMILWIVMAILPFALWPAMWVIPGDVIDAVYLKANRSVFTSHPKPRFFAGRIYDPNEPPNRLFYLVVLAFNTSFVSFVLAVLAVGLYLFWRKRVDLPVEPRIFWLLVAYVFFFTAQMTISDKQEARYNLPAHVGFELVAAVGVAGVAALVEQAFKKKRRQLYGWLVVGAAVLSQFVILLPYAPYYGAYRNHLFGGNQIAVKVLELSNENEGIIDVADYLYRNGVDDKKVGTTVMAGRSLMQYNDRVTEMRSGLHFYVFDTYHRQRSLNLDQWLEYYEQFEGIEPNLLVRFDGVDYIWLMVSDMTGEKAVPYEVVDYGGSGWIVVAWLWTIGLGVLVGLSLKKLKPAPQNATA
ncbi:MAG: glycosyltransferase family 39 protein [Anaerolineae bacterium]|nr:glycosyltransferase family 39 protein [Anaerolineae bacterium]